ncbi:hypothetical protein EK21DRAFT_118948 [Setomelanomma holmii]|uniref:RING-type domain-containing protein n=1 Tax=Setomelanomma holmii TaxID=210430 RepID=A0A9P4GY32_9PLEO|nr:hypothetical protein EK21DRAFT_118948 [Setomelanomma holmii]
MTCRKTQWRGVSSVTYAEASPERPSFRYDSQSAEDFLRKREVLSPMNSPHPAAKPDMTHLGDGPNGQPDIPERIWQQARPAAWSGPYESDTTHSTPLGTAFSPRFPRPPECGSPPPPLDLSRSHSRRTSVATGWSAIQRDATGAKATTSPELREPMPTPCRIETSRVSPLDMANLQEGIVDVEARIGKMSHNPRASDILTPEKAPIDDREASPNIIKISSDMFLPPDRMTRVVPLTPIAELPSRNTPVGLPALRTPIELHAEPVRVHSITLRELEGNFSHPQMMGKRDSAHVEPLRPQTANSTQTAARLTSMFQEVSDAIGYLDQEEFLLRHIANYSRAIPAPAGDYAICNEPFDDRRKRAIQIPDCGDSLHLECLVNSFQIRDQDYGTCPLCNLTLCKRTLVDRIDTDRQVIFGSQDAKLRSPVRIEFPQRTIALTVNSAEELAAAQLRLLKDYIDVHADELWQRWEGHRAEPDWYIGIICPAMQLFKGWIPPHLQQSRFFPDRVAFVKLIAWAEVVRLMNVLRAATKKSRGPLAPFPPLAKLHENFMWSKDRFDKEKKDLEDKCSWCARLRQDCSRDVPGCHEVPLGCVPTLAGRLSLFAGDLEQARLTVWSQSHDYI